MAKAKTATIKDIELNRWCVEMAMKWPTHIHGGFGGGGGGMSHSYVPQTITEADVIARAGKIMAWVKAPH